MREFRTYGSVRGAHGNGRPYRDQSLLVSEAKPGGGARFSPEVGTATRPPGGTEITTNDPGPEDYPSQGWAARTGQTARQCQPSLQNDGVQPGQLLPFQGAVRQRWRAGIAGDQPPQANPKEPHTDRDRTGGGRSGDRSAGLGPGARVGGTEAAGSVDLAGRGGD